MGRCATISFCFVLLSACVAELPAGYDPLLICHNSNCHDGPNVDEDDNLDSLEAGLELVLDDGRPAIDGIEIDLFWRGADDTCIYAHDLDQVDVATAVAPADLIVQHLIRRRDEGVAQTATGRPFTVFVEVKGHVGDSKSDKHTPEQRALHAACAIEVIERMAIPAESEAIELNVIVTALDPVLLADVARAVREAGREDTPFVHVGFGALFGVPPPLDSQSQPMADFPDEIGIELASVHPHWISRANLQAIHSRGWDLGYWMFSTVPETYGAIRRDRPTSITTNEAATLNAWMGR
jgi:hypothetical protein